MRFILPLRDRVKAATLFGPEIVASGPMVDNAPPEFPYRLHVTNAEEARVAVRELKRLGVDFIKVHDHTPREVRHRRGISSGIDGFRSRPPLGEGRGSR